MFGKSYQLGMAFDFGRGHELLQGGDDDALLGEQVGQSVVQLCRHSDRGRHFLLYRALCQRRQQAERRQGEFFLFGEMAFEQPGHQLRGFAGAAF